MNPEDLGGIVKYVVFRQLPIQPISDQTQVAHFAIQTQ